MNKIIEDFATFRDSVIGLNHSKHEITQNGVLFTVEYILCLHLNYTLGRVTADEMLDEYERTGLAIDQCLKGAGLLSRFPGSTEFDSMDNYTAMLVHDHLTNAGNFAKAMKLRGENLNATEYDLTQDPERNKKFFTLAKIVGFGKVKNFWNPSNPDKFCFFGWFGRSPLMMGLMDIVGHGKTSLWRELGVFVGQLLPIWENKSQDMWKLTFLVWQVVKERNFLYRWGYKLWLRHLYKTFPEGMKGVYASYYGEDHPMALYFPQMIE